MDLRALAALAPALPQHNRVLAPYAPADRELREAIAALRTGGTTVIIDLPGHDSTRDTLACARELVLREGRWQLIDRTRDQTAGK
jgi:ATP phosphoribosyltransferase regulatory subunit